MKIIFNLVLLSLFITPLNAQVLQKIPGLDSRFRETNMSITPNGKYLFFMSQRGGMPWSTRRSLMPGERIAQYDGDIWYSVKQGGTWSAPKVLGQNINTYSGEDEPNVTADGQRVYFQSWRDGWEWSGGPYYKAELNGKTWGKPIGLGGNITKFFKDLDLRLDKVFEQDLKKKDLYRDYVKYRTIYPFSWTTRLEKKGINFNEYILGTDGMAISPDEKIFIVSVFNPDKKKYDLYISRKNSAGTWSYPKVLSASQRSNEISVYIAGDNKTVYFASDRRGGMGGYDIYKTTLTGGAECTTPENLGAPYNSTRNDYGFVVDPTDDKAYQIIDGAIHEVALLEEAKPEESIVVNGKVTDQYGNPMEARIQLINVTGSSKVLASAKSNRITGEYSFSFSKDLGRYNQKAVSTGQLKGEKGFIISEKTGKVVNSTIIINKPIVEKEEKEVIVADKIVEEQKETEQSKKAPEVVEALKKEDLKAGTILTVDKLYFKSDSDELAETSSEVLDEIANILKNRNDILKVEIGGHTNGLPPDEYCNKLSKARAKMIYNYLAKRQVQPSKMVFKGYGKKQPIASNDTPEGRRKNQRVEIKILEVGK